MAKTTRKPAGTAAPQEKPKAKDLALQKSLAAEVHRLRAISQDISRRFLCKIESEMVRMTELAAEVPNTARKRAAVQSIVENIRKLDVKHNKGRLGDLRQIRTLVKETNQRLEELL